MKKTTKPTPESGDSAIAVIERPLEPEGTIAGDLQRLTPKVPDVDPHWTPGVPNPPPTPTLEPENPEAQKAKTPLAETLPESPPPSPPLPPVMATAVPAANPALRYFKKVQVQSPLYVDKVRITFEVLDQGIGVIKLNPATDARMIEVLDGFFKARKGGVVAIDEATYTSLKKNPRFLTFAQGSRLPKLRLWDSRPKQLSPSPNAPVAAAVRNNPLSSVAGSSRGSAASVVGGVAGAGTPATFVANLQRKSGVLKTPASGQFRADAGIPQFP